MENVFEYKGHTFKKIKSIVHHRPYRVLCIETMEEKDSALSYHDAASLIIEPHLYAENKIGNDSKDINYVKKIFTDALLRQKQSCCDKIVMEEIVERRLIAGDIVALAETEKYSKIKEYMTEYFLIQVLFERGLQCGATEVAVIPKKQ